MRTHPFAHVVLVVLASAACGNDPGGGGGGSISLDNLAQEVQAANCGVYVACGLLPDKATCDAVYPASQIPIGTIKAAVGAGRIVYHGDAARKCVNAIAALKSCSFSMQGTAYVNTCRDVFEGTVADGAACLASEECKSRSCVRNDPQCNTSTSCCPGKCAPTTQPVAIGGDCSGGKDCVDGAYCKIDTMSGKGTCQAQVAAGGACMSSSECKEGLLCGNTDTCMALPGENEDCSATGFCDRIDNYCDPATKRCVRDKPLGATCTSTSQCVGYAYCSTTCKARLKIGEACMNGGTPCLPNLNCTGGTCALGPTPPTCM